MFLSRQQHQSQTRMLDATVTEIILRDSQDNFSSYNKSHIKLTCAYSQITIYWKNIPIKKTLKKKHSVAYSNFPYHTENIHIQAKIPEISEFCFQTASPSLAIKEKIQIIPYTQLKLLNLFTPQNINHVLIHLSCFTEKD